MNVRYEGDKSIEPCSEWGEAIREQASGFSTKEESLQRHLAGCSRCRDYRDELRGLVRGVKELGTPSVEPSSEFHRRWVTTITTEAMPRTRSWFAEAARNWRDLLLAQLRPALALSPVWLLILFFRLSTPEPALAQLRPMTRSPLEVFQAFIANSQAYSGFPLRSQMAEGRQSPPVLAPGSSQRRRSGSSPGASLQRSVLVAFHGSVSKSRDFTFRMSNPDLRTLDFGPRTFYDASQQS